MKDAEKLSNNPNQNVQPVTEEKQENSATKADVQFSFPEPPVLQIDMSKLDSNMLKTAESIGIPLSAILKYVSDLQEYNAQTAQLVKAMYVNFDQAVQSSVGKMIADAQKKQAAQPAVIGQSQQTQPVAGQPAGGFNPTALLQYLPQILQMAGLGGGGGTGAIFGEEFLKTLQQGMIESALGDLALGKAIRTKVTESLGVNVGKAIAEKVNLAAIPPT